MNAKLVGAVVFAAVLLAALSFLLQRDPGVGQSEMSATPGNSLRVSSIVPNGSSSSLRVAVAETDGLGPDLDRGEVRDEKEHTASISELAGESNAAADAKAESERMDRLFAAYLDAGEAGLPTAGRFALSLANRCVAIELESKGRAVVLEPGRLQAGGVPRNSESEIRFVIGNKLYAYEPWEYPLLVDLTHAARGPQISDGQLSGAVLDPQTRSQVEDLYQATKATLAARWQRE